MKPGSDTAEVFIAPGTGGLTGVVGVFADGRIEERLGVQQRARRLTSRECRAQAAQCIDGL